MLPLGKWIFLIAALLLLAGFVYQKLADAGDRKKPAPGRLISVGSHKLHLLCKGNASWPTVVIEQGAGEPSRLWWLLQDQIAAFAHVCTYDRAGYGFSEPAPLGRTIDERAAELHTLLTNAAVPGPYILVAHSYGGLIVRAFARRFPAQTAGLVLVDTPHESNIFQKDVLDFYSKVGFLQGIVEFASRFGLLRLLGHCVNLDAIGFPFVRPVEYQALRDDLASLKLAANATPPADLGHLPLAVITHGQPFPGPFAVLEKGWSEGQHRLAALSSNSTLTIAQNSNHMIQLDEPAIIVDAIRRVLNNSKSPA
jgi:pimeloyl-ACP methyl ester carboxylesterase